MQIINGNYIDLIIIAVLICFTIDAIKHGFWVVSVNFFSFLSSLVLSLRFYKDISSFLKVNFSLGQSVSDATSFLIAAIVFESVAGFLLGFLISKLPEKIRRHKINNLFGILPGLGEGVIIVSFFVTLIIATPIRPQIKSDVTKSEIGSYLLSKTTIVEKNINQVFGGVINDSLTYFTINPETTESIDIEVFEYNLKIDELAESEMLSNVNEERKKNGIPELIFNSNLLPVARSHAKDMWERKYFAHVSPDNKDVGDRLTDAKVSYKIAGENLALAPTTLTAHNGLMNSKGHRENMLDIRFGKVAIGVIDNGIYGKMYVQVFTD
jgi:uncharacterized protein YkwD